MRCRKFFYCLFILAFIFSGQNGWGKTEDEVLGIIKNAPGAIEYPEAGALYLLVEKRVTIDDQGREFKETHSLIKILQDRARDSYCNQRVKFDGEKQRVIVEVARTHRPDGSIALPEEDAIMELSHPEAAQAPFYSNARLQVVAFPAIEPGAVMEFIYRIEPKEGVEEEEDKYKYFNGEIIFQTTEPILEKSLSLSVPTHRKVSYRMLNSDSEPVVTTEDGTTTYSWQFRDCEQIITEPGMVPIPNLAPRLLYSSLEDWDDLGGWFRDQYFDKLSGDQTVRERVKTITEGLTSTDDKIRAISFYLIKEVRTVWLGLGNTGYEPTLAPKILANKYGDRMDKTVLYLSMLREIGVQGFPAFVNHARVDFVDLPAIKQFNDLLVYLPQESGDGLWIDLTGETTEYGVLPDEEAGQRVFVVTPEEAYVTQSPEQNGAVNFTNTVMKLTLDKEGNLSGSVYSEVNGVTDARTRGVLKDKKDQELKMYFERLANGLKQGTKMISYDLPDLKKLDEDAWVKMEFHCDRYAFRQGDILLFEVPGNPFGFTYAGFNPSLPTVRHPALVRSTTVSEREIEVDFPEGLKVGYLPESLLVENDFMKLEMQTRREGSKIVIKKTVTWKRGVINPDGYPRLKKEYTDFVLPKNRLIIFEM